MSMRNYGAPQDHQYNFMPHLPSHENNGSPQRLTIKEHFNRDPLKPKTHKVLVEIEPGQWQIIGNTGEDLRTLRLAVGMNHAVDPSFRQRNCMIVDDDSVVEEKFECYTPESHKQGEPISEYNLKLRARWILAIVKWLLPSGMLDLPDTEETQNEIRKFLKEINVEISISPAGDKVIIWRDGAQLADWSC